MKAEEDMWDALGTTLCHHCGQEHKGFVFRAATSCDQASKVRFTEIAGGFQFWF